jgi:hypothetical protein
MHVLHLLEMLLLVRQGYLMFSSTKPVIRQISSETVNPSSHHKKYYQDVQNSFKSIVINVVAVIVIKLV